MNIINKFKNIFKEGENDKESNFLRNILILGLIGIIFLFAGNLFSSTNSSRTEPTSLKPVENDINQKSYQSELSQRLEETISLMKGVGQTRVQLITEQGPKYEYEYNVEQDNKITNETDQNGGERRIEEKNTKKDLVILRDNSGNEEPVKKVEIKPEITGVIIIAQGSEDSDIKYKIYKSVSRLLDLPLHKINVLPYGNGRR